MLAGACRWGACGALWIYVFKGEHFKISGSRATDTGVDRQPPALEIGICGACGRVTSCRGLAAEERPPL